MNERYKKWLWEVEDILRDEHGRMLTSSHAAKESFDRGLSPKDAVEAVLKEDDL